jgi:hypothetical protein
LYDRYGVPGFLAAYNSGPNRLEDYLAGGSSLPNETVNYLSAIAPRLGNPGGMTGPLAMYAVGETPMPLPTASALPMASSGARPVVNQMQRSGGCDPDAAYDPDRPCSVAQIPPESGTANIPNTAVCDPDAAYDPQMPCRTARTASVEAPYVRSSVPPVAVPGATHVRCRRGWYAAGVRWRGGLGHSSRRLRQSWARGWGGKPSPLGRARGARSGSGGRVDDDLGSRQCAVSGQIEWSNWQRRDRCVRRAAPTGARLHGDPTRLDLTTSRFIGAGRDDGTGR